MLNSGIGPVISKKINKANGLPKKPMNPGMSMYSLQMMNSQNKLQMPPNMALQPNPQAMMKSQDLNMNMQAQQQTSTMKIENVSLQSAKKVSSQIMFNKGMVSSPNLSQMSNTEKDSDIRPQMPQNPINMTLQQPLPTLMQTNSTKITNDKELAKSSEIPTLSLRIGSLKFTKENKITTKIVFGKRQFIWEVGDDDTKGQNKRKFELKFSDIDKIDVSIENSSIRIETREKPTGYKEHNTQLKKTSHWVKEAMYDTESEFGEDESRGGTIIIDLTFGKDVLTRSSPGKLSHLEKLKRCELPLSVDGKALDSIPSTPLKSAMSFTNFNDNFQQLPPSLQLHPSQSFMHQGNSHKKDMPFDLMLQSQNSLNLGHKDSISFDNLNLFKDPSEKLPEEDPQAEAEEDEEEKEFPLLTREKKADAKKFETQLKDMKTDEKIDIIMKTIKPKRFGLNPQSKKIYKCPLYKCTQQKTSVSQLKDHLKKNHKKVTELGFGVDDSGAFTWKNEHIDFALMVAKIYPKFVKNIVKEAKKAS